MSAGSFRSILSVRALAGVQLGIIGGLAMLVWFAAVAPLIGLPWWLVPNLFSSHFHGSWSVRAGFSFATFSGAALHLLVAGLVGALAGILHTGGRLFGLLVAVVCYLTGYFWLWKRIAPLLLTEVPQPVLAAGYFLYGSALGWHTQFVKGHENQGG